MVKLLDCTLRDGGYINDWVFGKETIKLIVSALDQSNVDFVELGYVSDCVSNPDSTNQISPISFSDFLTSERQNYLCMINFGDFDINHLPEQSKTRITGIRVAFKQKDLIKTIEYCKEIKKKGYKVFVQPMVTLSYTDETYRQLIELVNNLEPFAFYIVDSFGEMDEENLKHYFALADKYLKSSIFLGFHSHNNLQLSYSNCKAFINFKGQHNLIVDSSIFGMGRGAGNLNTEIFAGYLNQTYGQNYNINPIIDVIDRAIYNIYVNHFWGYSIPFFLSAKNHCHPNYALFLDNKKTLSFFDQEHILKSISIENKTIFNKEYITYLYEEYQNRNNPTSDLGTLTTLFSNKEVILIAPGPSAKFYESKIQMKRKDKLVVSINFIPLSVSPDFSFVSNIKRFNNIDSFGDTNIIVTTNIVSDLPKFRIPYFLLINGQENISDNAGLMCIQLMIKMGVRKIFLVGFDGYSLSPIQDYSEEKLQLAYRNNNQYLNKIISDQLKKYSKEISIEFLSRPKFINIL